MSYVPKRRDIVWLSFSPQKGREQAGRRPALVLSHQFYNERVGLMVVCAITSKTKGYPFEVALSDGLAVNGVVLADQIKNMDWRARRAEYACDVEEDLMTEVLKKLTKLVAARKRS